MGEQQDRKTTYRTTTFTIIKWTLVLLICLNILSSIWVGIYMNNRVETIKSRTDRRYWDQKTDHHLIRKGQIWKGVIITVLVLTDIASLVGIFGVIRENYCLTMVFGILMLTYAVFSAASDFTRGSISSWLVPFITGIIGCLFGHKIRVEVIHPTIYSTPVND